MGMIKVRSLVHRLDGHKIGSILEFKEEDAKKLVKKGLAELVDKSENDEATEEQSSPFFEPNDLKDLNIHQVRDIAKWVNVKGYSRKSKGDLIEKITKG